MVVQALVGRKTFDQPRGKYQLRRVAVGRVKMNHLVVFARLQIEYTHSFMNSRVAAELICDARHYGEARNKTFGKARTVGLPS